MEYIIADSNPARSHALQLKLKFFPETHFRGCFANEAAFLEEVLRYRPEVAFIYAGDSEINPFFVVEQIRARAPDTKIIILSENREYALLAFEIGADNFLLLPPDEVRLQNIFRNWTRS